MKKYAGKEANDFIKSERLMSAIDKLAEIFDHIDWKYIEAPPGSSLEKTELWPGKPDEDVMVCVYKGRYIGRREPSMPPTEEANRKSKGTPLTQS